MSNPDLDKGATVPVTHLMLHDLVNHLSIALGHSDLLLMQLEPEAVSRQSLIEIRDACRRAVDLVEGWRATLQPEG